MMLHARTLSGPEMLGRLLHAGPTATLVLDGVDFDMAAQVAADHSLGARLFAALQRHGLTECCTADRLQGLRAAFMTTVMRNRVRRKRAIEVLRAFADAGIHVTLLKGSIELLSQPNETDCLRAMQDIDLMVAPADMAPAYSILADLGFVTLSDYDVPDLHHGPTVFDPTVRLAVEVHTRSLDKPHPAFEADLLAGCATIAVEPGLFVGIPCLQDQILHNMVHAQESHAGFIIGTADLRHLLDFTEKATCLGARLNWDELLHTATQLGLRPHLVSWIYAAHRIFGLDVPVGLRFRSFERHQFRHIRNTALRPAALAAGERILLYHRLLFAGVFSARDLAVFYRYWAGALRHRLIAGTPPPETPIGGWPRGGNARGD